MNEFVTPPVLSPTEFDQECLSATNRFVAANRGLIDKSFWGLRMTTAVNLFLWHLDSFQKDENPIPNFVNAFNSASQILENAKNIDILSGNFPITSEANKPNYEDMVSGLFSDVWVDMTDDIYFDQTYDFTKERLIKSGVDPVNLFKNKVVVDAGCGSGKFSTAIAKFGAKKVIGIDIGKKGLKFAKEQAKKTEYEERLDYRFGSLLDIPLDDNSVDMVWSNGVIHHTLGYEACIKEFSRIIKPGGKLFLYVNGSFGLFELLQEKIRESIPDIPKPLMQTFLKTLGVDSGRLYWVMDCLYAPYEYKPKKEVVSLLENNGFTNITQLLRGVSSDQIEQVTTGVPYADVKYGDSQLKFLCDKN